MGRPLRKLRQADISEADTLILPLFHRHLVKRFNSLSEVNDEAEGKRETESAAL
jgi:hypothetical protein